MNVTYIKSASVLIQHNGVKILCDPWLVDGEYYGSWAHYPPYDFNPRDFDDVDYIYISHIHPDHFSRKTLEKMNKKIPVLIHSFQSKFLRSNLEKIGFGVQELGNNERTHLKNGISINILSADNCDPQLCAQFFGCVITDDTSVSPIVSSQIDTMSVIDNGDKVIVNTNDCPYELSYKAATEIKNRYKAIDFLLVGYSGAGAYPQCFDMGDKKKLEAAQSKRLQFLKQAERYIDLLRPKYYMPFAGRYTLAGKMAPFNDMRGVPDLEDAFQHFIHSDNIDQISSRCIILDTHEQFDISTGMQSKPHTPTDQASKNRYISEVLAKRLYDYESDPEPNAHELLVLIPAAFERFENFRKKVMYYSNTVVLLEISNEILVSIAFDGSGYKIVHISDYKKPERFVKLSLDKRLLKRILKGPAYAHWNNAEIGSHIHYARNPEVYERGIYHCMNFFYS